MHNRANLHRVRAAAGRAGAAARWANARREPTVQVRVFVADADWLKSQPGTVAENMRRLRAYKQEQERNEGKKPRLTTEESFPYSRETVL